MEPVTRTGPRRGGFVAAALPWGLMLVAVAAGPAVAAGCAFEPQGEGRVAAVIDSRTFRLQDGSEVRLAGIEPVVPEKASRTSALSAIIAGRDVTLRGEDDTPDRYGRQPAFVFLVGSETSVQGLLLAQGLGHRDKQGLCIASDCRGSCGAPGKTGNLGRSRRHKKRGKFGRYFGRDRALYAGRGQGFVRPAGRGNDLSELRAELDTGLCCDYFKAHDPGCRGCRNCP